MRRALIIVATAAAIACAAGTAQAGRGCENQPATVQEVSRGMSLADQVRKRLDASGANVVVLARAGQDLSRWNLRWSHLGFAYRDGAGPQAVWRVVHKLNHCGSSEGALYRQGLGEFFLDKPHRYEAAIVVLSPAVQDALLPALMDNQRLSAWHTPAYNMVAYPWSTQYQQSNQWALETLAGTMDRRLATRHETQRWLKARGYEPTTLHVDALTRLGARVGTAHIAFDDHPAGKRFSDRIETVTVDSVFEWLRLAGLGDNVVVVR